ncbi:hypothetical protein [Fibrella arboris]
MAENATYGLSTDLDNGPTYLAEADGAATLAGGNGMSANRYLKQKR